MKARASILIILISSACGSFLPTLSGNKGGENAPYDEDLASLRPTFELKERSALDSAVVTENLVDTAHSYEPVNDIVHAVLDSMSATKLSSNKVGGYTILVFSSRSREESRIAMGRLYKAVPDVEAELNFKQPFFRVKTGKFLHDYHAYTLLNAIKPEFPNAIIIPEVYKIIEPDEN